MGNQTWLMQTCVLAATLTWTTRTIRVGGGFVVNELDPNCCALAVCADGAAVEVSSSRVGAGGRLLSSAEGKIMGGSGVDGAGLADAINMVDCGGCVPKPRLPRPTQETFWFQTPEKNLLRTQETLWFQTPEKNLPPEGVPASSRTKSSADRSTTNSKVWPRNVSFVSVLSRFLFFLRILKKFESDLATILPPAFHKRVN